MYIGCTAGVQKHNVWRVLWRLTGNNVTVSVLVIIDGQVASLGR